MINKISTDKAPKAIGPYSQAVLCGGMLYTSGQIALSPESGEIVGENIAEQTEYEKSFSRFRKGGNKLPKCG